MAFVFGIEGVPIFEMLFVICILLLLGLMFILLELKKLTALILKEKQDLKRFEDDLSEFENDEGKKSSSQLVDFISNSIDKGLTLSQIEVSLIQRGWPKKEIDRIFDELEDARKGKEDESKSE
jgi:hypothetical protein